MSCLMRQSMWNSVLPKPTESLGRIEGAQGQSRHGLVRILLRAVEGLLEQGKTQEAVEPARKAVAMLRGQSCGEHLLADALSSLSRAVRADNDISVALECLEGIARRPPTAARHLRRDAPGTGATFPLVSAILVIFISNAVSCLRRSPSMTSLSPFADGFWTPTGRHPKPFAISRSVSTGSAMCSAKPERRPLRRQPMRNRSSSADGLSTPTGRHLKRCAISPSVFKQTRRCAARNWRGGRCDGRL